MIMKVLAIIPARGGSKSVPDKNIRDLAGFPLIAYSIAAAKLSKMITKIIVSTDSHKIASIARTYGAEVPFMRPDAISQDHSVDHEFMVHALQYLDHEFGYVPHYIVHVRPTTPWRTPEIMDEAIQLFYSKSDASALRSVQQTDTPYKLLHINDSGCLTGFFPGLGIPEYYNMPRQKYPPAYKANGYVDVLRPKVILEEGLMFGKSVLPFRTESTMDIDTDEQLKLAAAKMKNTDIWKYLKENYNEHT